MDRMYADAIELEQKRLLKQRHQRNMVTDLMDHTAEATAVNFRKDKLSNLSKELPDISETSQFRNIIPMCPESDSVMMQQVLVSQFMHRLAQIAKWALQQPDILSSCPEAFANVRTEKKTIEM